MNAMLKPTHEPQSWPCTFCWGKRTAMTEIRDSCGRPICALCARDNHRTPQMPSFVLDHILELES